ncbi:MAG: hypothetical protein IPJ06_00690 [Saprospiraceae bacterium]|nr:hypothetical protein [Saprospiraceae bacterium]
MKKDKIITIRELSPWRLPDGGIILEGFPSRQELERIELEVREARQNWQPGEAGEAIRQRLLSWIEAKVYIQFWDDIMEMMPEEGPAPVVALLRDVQIMEVTEGIGYDQLFVLCIDPVTKPTPWSSGEPDLASRHDPDSGLYRINVAELAFIQKI